MTPIFNIDQSHRSNEDFVSLYQTSNADIEVYNVQSKSWSGGVCLRVQCYLSPYLHSSVLVEGGFLIQPSSSLVCNTQSQFQSTK